MLKPLPKLKLHGFNNLTKSLSFCIYDINYTKTASCSREYGDYIDRYYNANRLTTILLNVCDIIGATVLNIAHQDYDPQGASVTILMADQAMSTTAPTDLDDTRYLAQTVVQHLDKSHICVHTYPETHAVDGISTFRADIEVSTCGVISPLKALDYLIGSFASDIVTLDYRVRGFTRDTNGMKHFIDHKIDSIQNFLANDAFHRYQMLDVNMHQENLFHTKMITKQFELSNFIVGLSEDELNDAEKTSISQQLEREMQEIFHGKNNT